MKGVTFSITVLLVDDDVRKVERVAQLLSGYSKELLKKIDQYISRNNISVKDYELKINTGEVIEERIIPRKVLSKDINEKEGHYTTILRRKYNYYSKIAGQKIRNQKEALDALVNRIYKLERSLLHNQGFGL